MLRAWLPITTARDGVCVCGLVWCAWVEIPTPALAAVGAAGRKARRLAAAADVDRGGFAIFGLLAGCLHLAQLHALHTHYLREGWCAK